MILLTLLCNDTAPSGENLFRVP